MNLHLKRLVLSAVLVTPMAAMAGASQAWTEQQLAANQPAAKESSNNPSTNKRAMALETKEQVLRSEVRDWAAIDTNKDHSISPEEMEKFLNQVWSTKSAG